MMRIEYSFSDSNTTNIIKADEMALRYNLFLGSLTLKKDNHSILIDWDWVPLLDFALCLLEIYKKLSNQSSGLQEFEFTESDAKLIFEKSIDKINIAASFSNETLETSFEEFQIATKKFYKDVINDILVKNKEIKENATFTKYLQETERM
ncbi:MAG: hypothetical protein LWX70_15980 [Sphingobacteriia bacterium]|nr:hypothetical protein [Sphingobacteriia bacterium]